MNIPDNYDDALAKVNTFYYYYCMFGVQERPRPCPKCIKICPAIAAVLTSNFRSVLDPRV